MLALRTETLDVDQPSAPYLDALVSVGFRGSTRFHVPGHKGGPGADPGLRHAIGDDALALDLPQDIEGIDIGPGTTPYERAEELAAQAYGAARTWFLTNGATQGNHALCLALAGPGRPVVVQRNSHASLIDGLVLSGGMPTFVAPEVEQGLGMAHGVMPDALRAALAEAGDAGAVFVVSPTYYGMAADVSGLAEVAHAAGTALVVDQAWGPHFGFHPGVPPSAVALGADAVLTSTHKIVGSLTQSAMLHLAPGGRIDPERLARSVRLVRSTSPSALLLGSLDAARRQLAVHGEALLERTLHAAGLAVAAIDAVPGVRVLGDDVVGAPGVAARDPLRVVIDVRGTGCTGYEIAAALVAAYDVKVELAAHAVIVLVLGLDQPVVALERFAHDFEVIVRRIARPGAPEPVIHAPVATAGAAVVSPRDAFLGRAEAVPVADAVGRISCEAIAGYPPGIPALLPGDRITAEVVDYLRELVDVGARLHGASDPAFQTVYVLHE
ncbi:MAG TPA: aminotransferase class I/II-fold pyridoxal phosphate-dependent enzyme [Solirubrobacteraceae bacterium]